MARHLFLYSNKECMNKKNAVELTHNFRFEFKQIVYKFAIFNKPF